MGNVYFITGIDTGVGKTVATGLLARYLIKRGYSVITQKLLQTGCDGVSEDILAHRKIMGIDMFDDDREGTTCPYIFRFPASPHLSADLENKKINTDIILNATLNLSSKYDYLLIEGLGGIHVPLNEELTTLDYIENQKYPLIIVSTPKLGSINHTFLTIESALSRKLTIKGILYNSVPYESKLIYDDTKKIIASFLQNKGLNIPLVEIPDIDIKKLPDINFSEIFE